MRNAHILAGGALMLGSLAACDGTHETERTTRLSRVDNRPVVQASAADFYERRTYVTEVRDALAKHGEAVVAALNAPGKTDGGGPVALFEVPLGAGKNGSATELSSHVAVDDGQGHTEQFVLGIERLVLSGGALGKRAAVLSAESAYLALDPDRFYVHEDARGDEQYPYSIPAVALDGSGAEATITFTAQSVFAVEGLGKANGGDGGVVVINALPYCDANPDDPECDTTGGGGGGGGSDDGDTGGGTAFAPEEDAPLPAYNLTGPPPAIPYLSIFGVMMADNGEDGPAEIQVLRGTGDNYGVDFSKRPRFEPDVRYIAQTGTSPYKGYTTYNRSAHIPFFTDCYTGNYRPNEEHVRVPDVSDDNFPYRFENMERRFLGQDPATCGGGWYVPTTDRIDGFALIDLSATTYRFLLYDDDHHYKEFSRRRSGGWAGDVNTYNMATGSYAMVNTRVNAESITFGSSDDPIPNSGIRNVTQSHVESRTNYGAYAIIAQVGTQFSYDLRYQVLN